MTKAAKVLKIEFGEEKMLSENTRTRQINNRFVQK